MNIRDLQYVVAVAELGHMGKAAQACHVSQPTLSMQLKKLEDYLGVTLFERSNKQVLITPVGEELLQRAKLIVQEANQLREAARAAQHPLSGIVRLGLFPTLAPYLLPHIMPAMQRSLPQIRWMLVEEKSAVLLEKLHRGDIDAALLALPLAGAAHGLESLALFDDALCIAVPHHHPLAKHTDVRLSDLQGQSLMLLEEGHCLRTQALDVCHMLQTSENPAFQATSLETLRHMVAAGEGVTLMPRLAMRAGDGITYLTLENDSIRRSIGLVWRKKSARETAIRALAEVITKVIM
jgi:LysR family transcriptional regulator, hydrogen peroxide-inducible genes activator